jgi:hypothetical protein
VTNNDPEAKSDDPAAIHDGSEEDWEVACSAPSEGSSKDNTAKWHTVESCIWHAEPLEEPWGQ